MAKKKKAVQDKRLIVMVLDASGSMADAADQVISGFDEYVADRRRDPAADKTYLMRVIFKTSGGYSSNSIDIAEPRPVADVPSIKGVYRADGLTPLYDAVGKALADADAFLEKNPDFNPAETSFITMTDGEENHSHEFTRELVFSLFDARQKAGWAIVHLGAGADAFQEGARLGVVANNASSYNTQKTSTAFQVLSRSTTSYYSDTNRRSRAGGQSVSFLTDDDRAVLQDGD